MLLAVVPAARAGTLAEDATAFGRRESIQWMDLSPSGKTLLAIVSGPGRKSIVRIIDAQTRQTKNIIMTDGDPETIRWCEFASDVQLVCKYGGYLPMGDKIVGFSRLVTMTTDGTAMKQLGQSTRLSETALLQFDGAILDWLPDEQGAVLMARNYVPDTAAGRTFVMDTREGLGVERIQLANVTRTRVEPSNLLASRYLSDGRGNVRMMMIDHLAGPDEELSGRSTFKYRRPGSRKWEIFSDYSSTTNEGDFPVAVDGTSNSAFVLAKTEGRDALYRVALDGTATRTLVAANSKVDIGNVVRLGRGQRVIGYTFVEAQRKTVYFDEEIKKLASGLAKALPHQPLVTFRSASADGSKLLIFAHGDVDPGSFYLFDKTSKKLDEVAMVRPGLIDRKLAPMQSISFPAADGVQVPAYLTLPLTGVTKNLPAIVLPHGGPSARDEWSFDWLVQFLAARGYAVIQPNYRGSAGYGDEWLSQNGFRGWRTSIGDVTAAAKYLVAQGIADPNKLAIAGWSYGGYAALQSAAVEPGLYKAAVAIAPVTDLALLKREADGFTSRRLTRDFVGTGAHVDEGSPLRRVAEIKVPVLMFHGDQDANVGIAHSEKMVAALKRAGVKAELVKYKGLEHQLDDTEARVQMLTRISEFLDGAVGK